MKIKKIPTSHIVNVGIKLDMYIIYFVKCFCIVSPEVLQFFIIVLLLLLIITIDTQRKLPKVRQLTAGRTKVSA